MNKEVAYQLPFNLPPEENKKDKVSIPHSSKMETIATGGRFMQMRFQWSAGASMFVISKVHVLDRHWYDLDGGEPLLSRLKEPFDKKSPEEEMKRWEEIREMMCDINPHPLLQPEQRELLYEIQDMLKL